MRKKMLILAIVAIYCLSFTQAETPQSEEEFSLQWNLDFGEVYVSTQAITSADAIFIRTSSSSLAQGIPSVYSLDFDGNEMWQMQNANSTKQDMSPLEFVKAGTGDCGNWPDMVLVGWSDGLFQALDAEDGTVVWQYQTEVLGWGITGSMLVETESVTIPTRNGLDKLCLNGDLQFTKNTAAGWRNGVTFAGQSYWIGDEDGRLWSVSNQSANSHFIAEGKIRHAPVSLSNNNLLIHLQTTSGSTIFQFNTTTNQSTAIVNSGYGPGMPKVFQDYIITTDSQNLMSISCHNQCSVIDYETFQSNGEISNVFDKIMLPQNTVEGGYGLFEISSEGQLNSLGLANYDDDWYGTAGIESRIIDDEKYMLLVNDNANLKLLTSSFDITVEENNDDTDWPTILVMLFALILISTTSIQLLRERFQSAFKFFILFCTILIYFTFADIIQAWDDLINEDVPASEAWNEDWPEEWLGTQVIVFQFQDNSVVIGGLIGYDNVLQLTQAAAIEQGMETEIIDSSLGKYVVSFDNIAGEGWEYTVNGQPGTVSVEYSQLESDSIVVWNQL
tara:strand:+ start:37 stop:1713 length:1677 start_codon:yes stop_codon:yes gene_type:complete